MLFMTNLSVTVLRPIWKVNVKRIASPPFGKCGQPPAVVVQRLAAEAALPVYHDSTGFARVALIYKKKRPEPKFGSLFGAEDGT